MIEEENLRTHRFVRLVFYPPWEEEHGCELVLRNGELLDYYGEADAYLAPVDKYFSQLRKLVFKIETQSPNPSYIMVVK